MQLPIFSHRSKLKTIAMPLSFRAASFTIAITSYLTTLVAISPSQAQTQKGFYCNTDSGIPTTTYHNSQGVSEPWIKWVSDHFSDAKWTPEARCQAVSERLEQYRQEGKLKYVTLGMENNQQVICVAEEDNGPCQGIVYTLKPGQDGIAALNNLFAWGSGQQNLESSYESSSIIPYINVGARLDEPNN